MLPRRSKRRRDNDAAAAAAASDAAADDAAEANGGGGGGGDFDDDDDYDDGDDDDDGAPRCVYFPPFPFLPPHPPFFPLRHRRRRDDAGLASRREGYLGDQHRGGGPSPTSVAERRHSFIECPPRRLRIEPHAVLPSQIARIDRLPGGESVLRERPNLCHFSCR